MQRYAIYEELVNIGKHRNNSEDIELTKNDDESGEKEVKAKACL